MRYRLSSDVFYRTYNSRVIVYQTDARKVYVYTAPAAEILDCFKEFCAAEECAAILCERHKLPESEREGLVSFAETLAKIGILQGEHELVEDMDSAENYFRQTSLPPFVLYGALIELTYRCNEKCRYCYCVTEEKGEMTTEEVKRILDELRAMNALEVTFTGGDLFVRSDALELIEYAYKIGLLVTVFTNGIALSDGDLLRLKACHLKSIHFSIYSHIPERHDFFTQVKGSFVRTTEIIKKCVLLGIPVNIKTTATEYNLNDLEGIIALAKTLGTTVQVGMTVCAGNDGNAEPLQYRVTSAEKLAKAIEVLRENVLFRCSSDFVLPRERDDVICSAGFNSLSVNPYGEAFPCNAYLLKCGSVRESSIKEIWEKSETLKELRTKRYADIKGCENCPDFQYCNFCPGSALTETGDPLKRFPEACTLVQAKKLAEKHRGGKA